MLVAEHIACLKLDRYKLEAHDRMIVSGIFKEITRKLEAVGRAVVAEVLHIPPDEFEAQLEAARRLGTSYLYEQRKHTLAGVSAFVSVVKDDDILDKNLVLPCKILQHHPRLTNHYILGVYLLGTGNALEINENTNIILAGWTDLPGILRDKTDTVPFSFKSKVPVITVPCTKLNPMTSFLSAVGREFVL